MSTSHPAETDADAESDSSRESFTGQGLPRVEDHRILTGEAEYIHDITPENCLHMALVRSMHAHAEIVSIDTGRPRPTGLRTRPHRRGYQGEQPDADRCRPHRDG